MKLFKISILLIIFSTISLDAFAQKEIKYMITSFKEYDNDGFFEKNGEHLGETAYITELDDTMLIKSTKRNGEKSKGNVINLDSTILNTRVYKEDGMTVKITSYPFQNEIEMTRTRRDGTIDEIIILKEQ